MRLSRMMAGASVMTSSIRCSPGRSSWAGAGVGGGHSRRKPGWLPAVAAGSPACCRDSGAPAGEEVTRAPEPVPGVCEPEAAGRPGKGTS